MVFVDIDYLFIWDRRLFEGRVIVSESLKYKFR